MTDSLYGIEDERKTVCVYIEQTGGVLVDISLELLAKGREMADRMGWILSGLLMGDRTAGLEGQVIACGADEVCLVEHPLLQNFTVDAYTHAAFSALMETKPSIFLVGATPDGRDLAGRLAVRLRTGLNADCTGLDLDPDGVLISKVSGFGGGVLALIQMARHRPQMATVRPGVFAPLEPDYSREGKVQHLAIDLVEEMVPTQILERMAGQGVDLGRAPVLIAGGRGVDGDFEMLRELAELLGGEVGATRPPVDEGHIERERQIGQTGVVCSPKIALCCGISGAFHFVVGIEKADIVIAINSDPEAPIFEYADYCILGDVHEVLPAFTALLKREREVNYA